MRDGRWGGKIHPGVRRWRRVAALVLLVGIVLSPLRAAAATVPELLAYGAVVEPTAMVRVETALVVGSFFVGNEAAPEEAAEGASTLFTAADVGPLPAAVANTFRGGSYTATTLSDATTLYRAYGGTAGQLGSYWTRVAPAGPLQATMDLALNPAWGNTAAQVARISVPAGTTIYEGAAAAQGALLGGGSQVFIPAVEASWLLP